MANDLENTTRNISTSEKTHAKNQEHTHIVNSLIASLGALYNPNNPLITAAAMLEFEESFGELMQGVNAAYADEQAKVGAQIAAFKLVPRRVSLIMKAAAAQGLASGFMTNLRSTANRINSIRVDKKTPDTSPATPPENPPETPPETPPAATPPVSTKSNISVSRRSYAGILESLGLFDEQLKGNPSFNPNEADYKPAAISAWIESLRTNHNAALDAKIATRSARNARNAYVYSQTEGIIIRMNAIKAYVETILDKNDPRLKQLKKLRFVDYSR